MESNHRDLGHFLLHLDPKAGKLRTLDGVIPPTVLTELAKDAKLAQPFEVDLALRLKKDRWYVAGSLHGEVELACSRCLDPFALALDVDVDRIYRVGKPETGQASAEDEADEVVFLKDGLFSVARMAEEELVLALPMVPLCQPDCPGLCQGCGAELKRESCQCQDQEPTSPFAVLQQALKGGMD